VSRLAIYAEDGALLSETGDGDEIALWLAGIGVTFERWPTRDVSGDILAAYAPEIERLKARGGYRSVDVVSVTPNHPDREAMRGKFLSEHTHAEDEVRFFVEGEGLFTLHAAERVWNVLCTKGDLMSVPAGTKHWFDMGAAPRFTAIRMFVNPDGWVAQFTGDPIHERFPRFELV
jgi:1,2-dihydroxy-3-keto-5-methylthiopentene dioxygenase